MKKAIAIIVLGLGLTLLNSCADSSGSKPFGHNPYNVGEILESNEHFIKIVTDKSLLGEYTTYGYRSTLTIPQKEAIKHCAKYKKYAHRFAWDFDSKGTYYRCYTTKTYKNDKGKKLSWFWSSHSVPQKNTTTASSTTTTEDINFTIDDKKEQCKAIGFEPATEKFADCVLRLVELDVNSQQLKQIALAQSQGNQQIADELRKQRKAQSSRYLMELGKQLSTPNAPASLPSTSTCSISGSGAYKTVSCW